MISLVDGNYTAIKIGGVDVTAYVVGATIDDSLEAVVDTAKIITNNAILLVAGIGLNPGNEITIQRGANFVDNIYIFRGYITSHLSKGMNVEIECSNKLWLLQQRQVTKSFDKNIDSEAGKISEIVKTLITVHGGLNADSTTIQDSGTTNTMVKYICRNDIVFERIMKLVDALIWQFYYNPIDDKVYFEPLGTKKYYKSLVFNATGQGVSSNAVPQLNKDFSELYNRITINGATQLDTRIETFVATAGQTTFILQAVPGQTEITVAGVLKTRAVLNDPGTYDYTVDETLKKVVFVVGISAGVTVIIKYGTYVPTPVVVDDEDSITQYCAFNPTTGEYTPFETTITYKDMISVSDAIIRANELLVYHAQPIIRYQASIYQTERLFFPGYLVNIVDDINLFYGDLIVRKTVRQYPDFLDVIYLADKRLIKKPAETDINTRLGIIERESLQNVNVLIHVKNYSRQTYYKRRCMYVKTQSTIKDGVWGIGFSDGATNHNLTWGATGALWQTTGWTDSPITTQILQGNNTFEEYFTDNEFVDTLNTTCTIDTTNLQVLN